MAEAPEVFVSYARTDKERVLELAGKLRAAGVSLWLDTSGIDAATLWGEQIVHALESAKVLLLMLTGSAAESKNVAREVMLVSERNGNILPVHLEPMQIPPTLKYQLAGIQHVECFTESDSTDSLKTIVRALQRLGVKVGTPPLETKSPEPAVQAARANAEPAAGVERGALAVLPFDNISPDTETDYFSNGLTEELTARLSMLRDIELVSRSATRQFKDSRHDISAIGRELGARYVVGGTVRRFQESVRITTQLEDVSTNRQMWGNTYKGKLDDIFDIQEQVAQQIVEALKLKLTFSEKLSLTKRQTVNAQAYDLYLRGQDFLYHLTKSSVELAIQLFEKAIELDPRYAAAYAGCSSAYGHLYWMVLREEKYREKARELSFMALMYDNNLAEAYTAMGISYFIWGKFEEAGASARKAIELDPDDFIAYWTLGRIYFATGEFALAYDAYQRVIKLKPEFINAYTDFRMVCQKLGREQDASRAGGEMLARLPTYLLQNPDDGRQRLVYAYTLAEAGRNDEALRETAKAQELTPSDPLMVYNVACVYARLGEPRRAIEALRQAISAGYENFSWLRNDPDLDAVREDADFKALMTGR